MECQQCEDDNKPEKTMCGCDFLRHKKNVMYHQRENAYANLFFVQNENMLK